MTLLAGQPGDHNEGDRPTIEPATTTAQLAQITFPPRSLVRLEVNAEESRLFLPVAIGKN